MNRPMTNRLKTIDGVFEMLDDASLSRPWRARSRWYALQCAWNGLREAWLTQPNLRLHTLAAVIAVALAAWCRLPLVEWLWVSFAIGLVIFAELMNTAIEQTVDLVVGLRPDPLARRVKDAAAGCVLVAAITAAAIGLMTFGPRLLQILF